ncbi:PREDICTED: translocon-associated protein subunit beta isoform X2 [Haliaeetus leucocephalus]|uniref:translocon-associated protein subunit beta isoform X2 n=1 Tax=Haliaeetus leucocephalus TaxID=52644 RepID=UPI00053CC864|nr:PREDICTED: translocon-associated protein subunit beta isoform X2 [Haliaeetus leucocephalus]
MERNTSASTLFPRREAPERHEAGQRPERRALRRRGVVAPPTGGRAKTTFPRLPRAAAEAPFSGLPCFRCLCADTAFRGAGTMKLLVLAVFALFYVAHCEEGARLLASKSLLNRYAVEGKDLTLQYNIYNVGSSAALDVELSDDSFPPEDFGIVSGMLNVKWDRIAPASNVSHTVVLRPLKAGYFNFTSATITYLAQEGGQVVVGFTSAPGQGGILAQREFDRRFSPHFFVVCLVCTTVT